MEAEPKMQIIQKMKIFISNPVLGLGIVNKTHKERERETQL